MPSRHAGRHFPDSTLINDVEQAKLIDFDRDIYCHDFRLLSSDDNQSKAYDQNRLFLLDCRGRWSEPLLKREREKKERKGWEKD